MNYRRILSFLLAFLMMFSTFAELIPADVFASEIQEETEPTETTGESIASYEIPLDQVTINEDGSLNIILPDTVSADGESVGTEPVETEPAETEPVETDPVETESVETELVETEPAETDPIETEPAETDPIETEPAETDPIETESSATEAAETLYLQSWFEWIEEKGIDTSVLTKEELGALSAEYSAYRINTLAEMGELPEGATAGTVANDYLEIAVGSDGLFTIGTRIGNPDYTSDNNKKLLYGHPSPWSSQTLIYIDNGAYSTFFHADTISYSADTATATMLIPDYGIKVVQTLKLVKSGDVSFKDTVQIQYQAYNTGSSNRSVGIRIMLDTMLANNDHAPFHITSVGNVTKGKVFTGSAIPKLYQVYDNLDNPTTMATGCLYKDNDRKPDKVQFCNWGNISGSGWNHYVADGSTLGDSAVGIYFNPVTIKPGKSTTVRTYYGVSVSAGGNASEEILGDQVMITVKDNDTREPLAGVDVTCIADGQEHSSGTTGANGVVVLNGWNRNFGGSTNIPLSIKLQMELDGYKTSVVNCNMAGGSQYTYYLSRSNTTKPNVNSVVLKTDSGELDLLTKTCKYVEDGDNEIGKKGATGTVTIKATSDLANCTWLLVQDERVLQRNARGEFVLNIRKTDDYTLIEDLKAGANLYIQAVAQDGTESEKMRLGLRVSAKSTKFEWFPLSMGELLPTGSSPIAEGTLAAIFLGNKFEFKLNKNESLKLQVELVDGGKVRVGLNFTAKEWDSMNKKLDNGQTKQELVDSLAKEMKQFAEEKKKEGLKAKTGGLTKYYYGNAKADFAICGYGEGSLEDGSIRIDLTVFAALSGELSHTTQFLAGTIPCYIQVGGKAKAQLQGSANLKNSEGWQFFDWYNAQFAPSAGIWLEGGAGIKGAVSVGARGEGTATLTCNLVTDHQLGELEASASIVAKVAFWEKDFPFAKKTIVFYDSNDRDGTVYGAEDDIGEMLDSIPFQLLTREEMSGENAEGGSAGSGYDTKLLNVGGTQYKFWLGDRGGDEANRFMLVYSKLEDGVWSEEIAVDNDGTTDMYYDVATDGTNIYVVWSDSSKTFGEDVTLDEMILAQEISFTTIGADGTIAAPLTLTHDSAMDIMPAVTTVGNSAYIAWYHTANGIEANTDIDNHYLYYTCITNGTAGEISTVNCSNAAISSIHAATVGSLPMATYVTNASDEYTFVDSVTHEIDMSNGTIQEVDTTDKTVGKAVTAVIDGEEQVFWMEDGNIAYADSMNAENPAYVFTEETIPGTIGIQNYTVITLGSTTYLIWVESSPEGSIAMTSIYSGGTWSQAHKLTDLASGSIDSLDGYENSDGKLVLVYSVTNMTNVDDSNVDVSTITLEKIVEPEQTVRISSIDFEITDAIPGQELPLTVTLENTGNTAVDTLNVSINSSANENFNSQLVGINLLPGTTKTLHITGFVPSSNLTTRTTRQGQYVYTVTIGTEDSSVNVQDTFEIGYDKVVLYKQELALVDGRENIVIAVENRSGFEATNVRVKVLADAVDGTLVYDNTFDRIGANGRVSIYLDVEELNSSSLFASVSSDCIASEQAAYTELYLSDSITPTLTVDVYGCGTVTPAAPVEIKAGETAEITATANPGYTFDGWYCHKELTFLAGDENSSYTEILMPAGDTTITARFVSETPYDFTLSASADLAAGETLTLNPQFASPEQTGKVIWSSSNDTIASVSDRGVVTALAEGTATITATCGDYVHTCTVTVSYVDVTEIRMVYPELNLAIGETSPVDVLTDPENGNASLIWTSSDESVITVDSMGNVTALDYGTAIITAAAQTNPDVTAQCTVNVILPVEDIYLDQSELFMSLQENQAQLNVVYEPMDANFGKNITWSVDNRDILEIAASGDHNETLSVTALKCGVATITATSEDGHTVSCAVHVEDVVYVSSVEELQTQHNPYEANVDRTWVYTDETKDFLVVTFDEETRLSSYDTLYIMDGSNNVIEQGNGSNFSGRRIFVEDDTVRIRLVSGSSTNYYGFRVAEISDTVTAEDIYLEIYDQYCTGKAIIPEVYAYLHSLELTEGEDYTLKFSNNKNVGIATVKFIGKNRFKGVETQTTFRILPSPTDLNATIDKNGIKLTWAASKGAGNYDLYRSVDGGYMELYKTLSGSAKSFTDKDTNAEHYYHYQLIPYKKVTTNKITTRYEAPYASCGPVTRLGPVKKLTAVTDQEAGIANRYFNVTLSWDALEGADGYFIQYSYDNSNYFYNYTSTSNTTYTLYVSDMGKMQYRIVPYKYVRGYTCEGAASNVISVYGLDAPILGAEQGSKGVDLWYSHSGIDGKTGVEIQRSLDGGNTWKKYKTINTSYDHSWGDVTDTSAKKSGTYYQYRARTFVKDGKTTYYSPFSGVESVLYLAAPSISTVKTSQNGGLDITWKPVAGAQSYEIYRYYYNGNGDGDDADFEYTVTEADLKAKTLTFTDTTATASGTYEYVIRACASKEGTWFESYYSNDKKGYILDTPSLYYLKNSKKGTELSWNWVNYADGFEVWRSVDGSAFKKLKTLKQTTYLNDTSASKNGAEYQYQIRAYVKEGSTTFYSGFVTSESIVKMTPPTLKKAVALTTGGFEITFNAVKDAQAYMVWRYNPDGSSSLVAELDQASKAKTYTVTDVAATAENILFEYEILAYRETEETYADASWYVYCYNFGKPEITAENAEKGIMVYASVPDAEGYSYADTYTIYRSENNGTTWKKLKTVNADNNGNLTYHDTTTKTDKTYSYKAEASGKRYMDAFTSLESDVVTLKCAPGPKQAKLSLSREGVVISWSTQKNMSQADSYQIWRSQDGYHFEMIGLTDSETFTFTDPQPHYDDNLYLEDLFYYYKVVAIPAEENAPTTSSSIQKILVCMENPWIRDIWYPDEKSIAFAWSSEGYIDGFEVRYVTNGRAKTAKVKVQNDWHYILKNVKAGQEYEVSVRGYFKWNNVTYYSAWSEPEIFRG